jgi:hypothetical protein
MEEERTSNKKEEKVIEKSGYNPEESIPIET